MSADWKAGDRALCVERFNGWIVWPDGSIDPASSPMPKLGVVYLVTDVDQGHKCPCLHLAGFDIRDDVHGYTSAKFRKVVPACDRVAIVEEATA